MNEGVTSVGIPMKRAGTITLTSSEQQKARSSTTLSGSRYWPRKQWKARLTKLPVAGEIKIKHRKEGTTAAATTDMKVTTLSPKVESTIEARGGRKIRVVMSVEQGQKNHDRGGRCDARSRSQAGMTGCSETGRYSLPRGKEKATVFS